MSRGFLKKDMISIHALHAECDGTLPSDIDDINISIHALHAECDCIMPFEFTQYLISIHALHAECDQNVALIKY